MISSPDHDQLFAAIKTSEKASPATTAFRTRLVVGLAMLAMLAASPGVQAQIVPACGLIPSFCEMRGQVFDGDRCRCVKPGRVPPSSPCLLVPFFCELRGEKFDGKRCRCVGPRGPARRDSCASVPALCEGRRAAAGGAAGWAAGA
jgi:hypothetical protein